MRSGISTSCEPLLQNMCRIIYYSQDRVAINYCIQSACWLMFTQPTGSKSTNWDSEWLLKYYLFLSIHVAVLGFPLDLTEFSHIILDLSPQFWEAYTVRQHLLFYCGLHYGVRFLCLPWQSTPTHQSDVGPAPVPEKRSRRLVMRFTCMHDIICLYLCMYICSYVLAVFRSVKMYTCSMKRPVYRSLKNSSLDCIHVCSINRIAIILSSQPSSSRQFTITWPLTPECWTWQWRTRQTSSQLSGTW